MLQSAESPAPVVELEKFDDLQAPRTTQATDTTRSQTPRHIVTTVLLLAHQGPSRRWERFAKPLRQQSQLPLRQKSKCYATGLLGLSGKSKILAIKRVEK